MPRSSRPLKQDEPSSPHKRPRRGSHRLALPALLAAALGGVAALGQSGLERFVDSLLPDAGMISSFNRPGTLTVLSMDGEVVWKQGPVTREKLRSGKMPKLVEEAFIAAEDHRFYRHQGIDPLGISRAMVRNISRGSVEEGASTITQQLARMVFLSQDLTLWRKLKEAALAGKIERQLNKQQILEQYLNLVYLGSSAYGISDAAWIYFSKTPDELTLPEAAMIAGLPPAPSVYSPLVNPDLALQRRSIVLDRMVVAGYINEGERAAAEAAPLGLDPADPKFFLSKAPWFTSWLVSELPSTLSKEQLEVGGITIRSGLNQAWQVEAQKAVNTYAPGGMEGAAVIMEPGTGLVRAMVGGKDYLSSQFNRASHALRSPGSTFKLFTYTAALKYGLKPEYVVANTKQCFAGFCVKAKGPTKVNLVQAVSRSYNAAAVATARKVGYGRVIGVARDFGITSELGEYPSMVIGANEQYMVDMTAAYAAINNRGVYVKPTPFEEIYGPDGNLIWSRRVDAKPGKRAVTSEVADAMQWMLLQVVSSGTGSPARLPGRPVAGKTGTSEGARDLWFIGSIPQLTTGIWLGYDNNRKTRSSSAQAAYAWHSLMSKVVKGLPVQQFPPKPVLTGSFIPIKPGPAKPKPTTDTTRQRERKQAQPEPPDSLERPRSDWREESDLDIDTWEPPPLEDRSSPPSDEPPELEPRSLQQQLDTVTPRRQAAPPTPEPRAPQPQPQSQPQPGPQPQPRAPEPQPRAPEPPAVTPVPVPETTAPPVQAPPPVLAPPPPPP